MPLHAAWSSSTNAVRSSGARGAADAVETAACIASRSWASERHGSASHVALSKPPLACHPRSATCSFAHAARRCRRSLATGEAAGGMRRGAAWPTTADCSRSHKLRIRASSSLRVFQYWARLAPASEAPALALDADGVGTATAGGGVSSAANSSRQHGSLPSKCSTLSLALRARSEIEQPPP